VLLLVLMLVFAWYGVDGIPGRPGSRGHVIATETGWQGLTGVRWLVLLTVLVALATLAVHAVGPARQTVAGLRLALLVLGSATALALITRVLIDLPSPGRVVDQKLGALLGAIASLGIAYGSSDAVREQRARLAAAAAASTAESTGAAPPHPPR
jgi:hypothetical protein